MKAKRFKKQISFLLFLFKSNIFEGEKVEVFFSSCEKLRFRYSKSATSDLNCSKNFAKVQPQLKAMLATMRLAWENAKGLSCVFYGWIVCKIAIGRICKKSCNGQCMGFMFNAHIRVYFGM